MPETKPGMRQRVAKWLLADAMPTQSERVVIVHGDNIGSAGTRSFSGFPNEEYFNTLRGYRRADMFDQMRRSDATIIMLLNAVKNIIRSCKWRIDPGDDTPEAQQDADLIEHILFNDMETSWDDFINESLTMLEFGHSVFEKTDKIVQNDPKFGNYIGIKDLAWRSARTIYKWNLDPLTGKLLSVTQLAFGDLDRYVDIPAEYLLIMTVNKEGALYEGISWLRACYGSFIRKKEYMKLNAIGIEKFAIPTPIAKVPNNQENTPQFANLKEVLENFVAHESQYIIHPTPDWDVQLVPNNQYDPSKVEASVDAEDRRMTNAFLANFLNLGQSGSGGSYALSNDLSDFFTSGLDYLARIIEQEINRNVIVNTIKLNKGPRPTYPKLCHSGISDRAGEELARSLDFLARSQVIVPDDVLEESIRERYNFPAKSDQGQRKVQDKGGGFGSASPLTGLSENHIYQAIKLAEKKRRMK